MIQVPVLAAIVAAPVVGSFLGVLVTRLPAGRQVVWGRSECDHCHRALTARDLIPLASWLLLRGRCRHCGAPIGLTPFAMEVGALAVALMAAGQMTGWLLFAGCVFGWWLLTLAVLDWQHFWLPDGLTLPLIPAGLLVAYAIAPGLVVLHLAAAALGGASVWLIAIAYRAIRKREGLGLGDVKLVAALGAWLGPAGLPGALLYAVALALLWVIALALYERRVSGSDRIALGTFLAAAGWLVWLYGPLVPA